MATREYLEGNSTAQISVKYRWPEQTVCSWLNRVEERGLDDGATDESQPGCPSALSDEQRQRFQDAVQNPPEDVGIDDEFSTFPMHTSTGLQQHGEFTEPASRLYLNGADNGAKMPNTALANTDRYEETLFIFEEGDDVQLIWEASSG